MVAVNSINDKVTRLYFVHLLVESGIAPCTHCLLKVSKHWSVAVGKRSSAHLQHYYLRPVDVTYLNYCALIFFLFHKLCYDILVPVRTKISTFNNISLCFFWTAVQNLGGKQPVVCPILFFFFLKAILVLFMLKQANRP